MSNARNIANLPNGDGAPIYACRAWVNFDGTLTFSPNPGTNTIRNHGNISSISDDGGTGGTYTINFDKDMPDNDYVVAACGRHQNGVSDSGIIVTVQTSDGETNVTAGSVKITTMNSATNLTNSPFVSVAIFR